MLRQCAWCLYIIDNEGERLSPAPVSKLYEATHGICGTCGLAWMEQVMATDEGQVDENGRIFPEVEQHVLQERRKTITQLILELQSKPAETLPVLPLKPAKQTGSF